LVGSILTVCFSMWFLHSPRSHCLWKLKISILQNLHAHLTEVHRVGLLGLCVSCVGLGCDCVSCLLLFVM
jgi:hypothetical protein